jgi:hypothetical protein
MVTQFSWDDIADPTFENPARQAWRSAVAEVASKAETKLPECASRVAKAVALVLHNDVQLLADGTARVGSQSNANLSYLIVNGHCDCRDFARAPHKFCSHRLSAAIARRAQELVKAKLGATIAQQDSHTEHQPAQVQPQEQPVSTLPEAPASCNVYVNIGGRQVQVTLRDTDEQHMLTRLETLLQRFPMVEEPREHTQKEGWCSKHKSQMKRKTNEKGSWWFHKTAEGWCHGK